MSIFLATASNVGTMGTMETTTQTKEPTAETRMVASDLRAAGFRVSFPAEGMFAGWAQVSLRTRPVYECQVVSALDVDFEPGMYEIKSGQMSVFVRAVVG